jgi:hypothetical protein
MDHLESFMRQIAASEDGACVPPPGTIWWRAELRRRMVLEERAMRPVRVAEGIACALGLAAMVVLAGQLGPSGALQFLIR